MEINIKGLDKAHVLKSLWDASHDQGLSFLGLPANNNFTLVMAEEEIKNNPSMNFDYVCGKVIKCDISGDTFDGWLFDRDCGPGAAARAVDNLRHNMEVNNNESNN